MREILLKSVHAENFKTFKEVDLSFDKKSKVYAKNYTGKSSIADLVSWVLFGKSSTGNVEGKNFRPRRYDQSGVNIDHVDVVAKIVLCIDGTDTTIRRVQKQKWVRHKGSADKVYEGDKTEFFWDDVPTTPTEHKKKVAEILDEDVFYMLINPATFPSMPWKKQREYLTDHIAKITDADVLSLQKYAELNSVIGNKTLDEFLKSTKEKIKGFKKKQDEIPVRIDQESKSIQELDFSKEETRLAELEKELEETEKAIDNTATMYEEKNRISVEMAEIKGKMVDLELSEKDRIHKKRSELQDKISAANDAFNVARDRLKQIEFANEKTDSIIRVKKEEVDSIREKYNAKAKETFDENTLTCPTCGQSFPEDRQKEMRQHFEDEKNNTLRGYLSRAEELKKHIEESQSDIDSTDDEIKKLKEEEVKAVGEKNNLSQELDSISTEIVPSEIEGWSELRDQYNELGQKLQEIDVSDADKLKADLMEKKSGIQYEIDTVKSNLALKAVMEQKQQTVKDLEDELRTVSQNLADAEQLEFDIEECIREKMDLLSEKINSMFSVVSWKLFNELKQGGWEECCVCQIHGSDYGENTTSTTERMMAGMDIIRTLQELNEVKAPIFLDDADLYNDFNVPGMDCQVIKLCVSEDDELRVEVE